MGRGRGCGEREIECGGGDVEEGEEREAEDTGVAVDEGRRPDSGDTTS